MKNHSPGWRGNPSQRDARGPRHEQHRRPNEGPRAPERSLEELWPGYLKDGYFSGRDAAGRPLLFPDFLARSRLDPLVGQMAKSDPPLWMSQAWRFFGHCRSLKEYCKN